MLETTGTGHCPTVDATRVMPRKAIALVGGFFLLYLSWQAFHWIPGNPSQVGDLFLILIDAAAVFVCWRASRRCSAVSRLRWFWLLVALAIAGQLAGDTTVAVYDFAGVEVPFPSLADLFYLSTYPLMLAALLCVPVAPTSGTQRVRLGLDITTVLGAGAMVVWYFVLKQVVLEGGTSALAVATSGWTRMVFSASIVKCFMSCSFGGLTAMTFITPIRTTGKGIRSEILVGEARAMW